MPKITKPLTDTEIRRSKPKERVYKLSDGKGLYLVVQKNGTKFFRFDYSFEGKRKSMSFGVYPEITLKQARDKREETRELIKNNIDPVVSKKTVTADQTTLFFEIVSEKWLDMMKSSWTENNYNKVKGRLANHAYPHLGKKKIKDITRANVLFAIEKLQKRNLHENAYRVLNDIERIYKYATTYGYVEHNIIADIDKSAILVKKDVKHMPAITDKSELKKLLIDIEGYESEYKSDISTAYALKLAPYLFLRPFNLRSLTWNEVDFENKLIDIPKDKMKMRNDFVLPLNDKAIEILKAIKPYSYNVSEYVFPSPTSNKKPLSENTINHALMRLGYKGQMTCHGFRSTFSTNAYENQQEHGCSEEVIEACLAHVETNQVKAAYNRDSKMKYFDEKRKLINWWGEWLSSINRDF